MSGIGDAPGEQSGDKVDIVPNAGNLLNDVISKAGGVQGLLGHFDQAGLGDHVRSWIGDGQNWPISTAEIERVIPPAQLAALGDAHGLPASAVSWVLAQLLPHAVDAASTPAQDKS